jgi:hypothetical protein
LTLGLGAFFLLLGVLRLVQTEWDRAASGRLSWLAYLIVFVLTLLALALTLSRIRKSSLYPSTDDRPRQEASR